MRASIVTTAALILFFMYAGNLYAKPKAEFAKDGMLIIGASSERYDTGVQDIITLKLNGKVTFSDRISAFFDIKGSSREFGVKVRDAGVSALFQKGGALTFGNLKKQWGIEESSSREKLFTSDRSYLNEYLTSFGILDRSITLLAELQREWKEAEYHSSFSISGTGNSFLSGTIRFERTKKDLSAGVNAMYTYHYAYVGNSKISNPIFTQSEQGGQSDSYIERNKNSHFFLIGIDGVIKKHPHYADLEIFTGKDPNESAVSNRSGDSLRIIFAGIRTSYARRIPLNGNLFKAIEPVAVLSGTVLELPGQNEFKYQIMPGINVHFDKKGRVRWMTNAEATFSYRHSDRETGVNDYKGLTQVMVRW